MKPILRRVFIRARCEGPAQFVAENPDAAGLHGAQRTYQCDQCCFAGTGGPGEDNNLACFYAQADIAQHVVPAEAGIVFVAHNPL